MPIELDYGAIAIDTSVFDGYGLALEKGWLAQLEQFAKGPVRLLQSEIVHFELENHLAAKIRDAKASVARALKDAGSELLVSDAVIEGARASLINLKSDVELANDRLGQFYERTHAEIAPAKIADMDIIVDMYFHQKPPFEEKKKDEFPDAIALVSLEKWAKENKTKVLVVSHDKGWESYCKSSERLDYMGELKAALVHFQPHTNAERLMEELKEELSHYDKHSHIQTAITSVIEWGVSNLTVYANADSYLDVEEMSTSTTYVAHEFNMDINLIRASKDALVIQVGVEVTFEAEGEFKVSLQEGPLGIDVPYGFVTVKQQDDFDTDVLLTFEGDFSEGLDGVKIPNLEFTETKVSVNFGELPVGEALNRYD